MLRAHRWPRRFHHRRYRDDDDGADGADDAGQPVRVGGPAAVAELYSPPRVTQALPAGAGLVAGSTFDLIADAAGVKWDFAKPLDRKRAWDRIFAEEPSLIVGSATRFTLLSLPGPSTHLTPPSTHVTYESALLRTIRSH